MSSVIEKSSDADLRHRVAFDAPLLAQGEHVVDDAGWLLQKVTPSGAPATVCVQTVGASWSEACIEGGRPGETYLVTAQARTTAGRTIKRSFVLRIFG